MSKNFQYHRYSKTYFHSFIPLNLNSLTSFRSSHRRCSVKKGVLRNFAKFTGKHLCQSLFFNKVAGLRPETLLKKRLWHKCFPVNFAKFLRTPFLQNTSGRLLVLFEWVNSFIYVEKLSCIRTYKRIIL